MAPYILDQQINTGSYIPTTNIYDVSTIKDIDIKSPEFKDLIIQLYQTINNISLVLNTKISSYYLNQEFNTGGLLFNSNLAINDFQQLRNIFRLVVNTGALGAGVTNIAHGLTITNTWVFTYIGGAASNTVTSTYYPLPFSGAGAGDIAVSVGPANISINNASGKTFDQSYIVMDYVKIL